jgi:hypothetical protein
MSEQCKGPIGQAGALKLQDPHECDETIAAAGYELARVARLRIGAGANRRLAHSLAIAESCDHENSAPGVRVYTA